MNLQISKPGPKSPKTNQNVIKTKPIIFPKRLISDSYQENL